ncbi:MAG: hypothetical protein Q7S74_03735 [Nanoarchaeota archaeon]|nr:hypothetical protein [Nanoarchaeota archaeon]
MNSGVLEVRLDNERLLKEIHHDSNGNYYLGKERVEPVIVSPPILRHIQVYRSIDSPELVPCREWIQKAILFYMKEKDYPLADSFIIWEASAQTIKEVDTRKNEYIESVNELKVYLQFCRCGVSKDL